MDHDQASDGLNAIGAAAVAGKNAPPLGVAVLSLGGVPLDQWVYVATLIWIILQIGGWCFDRYKKHFYKGHDRRKSSRKSDDSQP